MRFSPSFLDDIKARVPVSEVVRRRVTLKKAGREFVGLSPFGQEKTPSFFVNDSKMAWFDFSSGKNGNIFDFVMETEGLTFPETVEMLAGEAGLALPARTPETEREEKRRAGLHEVCEWAAAFFEAELRSERGARARAYLDGRRIEARSRTEFRIGYAPSGRHALRDALAAKGADVATMCEAGLLIHGDDVAVPYDRFRERVMFPIHDRSGRVIAFGGRALEKDVAAKYLNSPETPLFQKGRLLFNHHRARKAAHDRERVIAVEGYIDVVAMHAAGFPETVAGLGTALTDEQAGLLWSMARQPVLCFDGDKAGRKAAARAAAMAMPHLGPDRTLAFALLPEGQDPDDLIRTAGAPAVETALAAALPLVDLVWSRATEGRPLATPEHRAALEREMAETAATIKDEALRRHYRAEFDARLRALFGIPERREPRARGSQTGRDGYAARRPFRPGQPPERVGYLSAPALASASLVQSLKPNAALPPREALILLILLTRPELIEDHAEDVAALDFDDFGVSGRELAALRDRILDLAHDLALDGAGAAMADALTAAGFGPALERIMRSRTGSGWYLAPEAPSSDAAFVLRQALVLHHETRALHKELLSAETALATDASDANMARMRDIQEQLSALAGKEAAAEGFGATTGRLATTL